MPACTVSHVGFYRQADSYTAGGSNIFSGRQAILYTVANSSKASAGLEEFLCQRTAVVKGGELVTV